MPQFEMAARLNTKKNPRDAWAKVCEVIRGTCRDSGPPPSAIKLDFHGTDTDILVDFRARIVATMSACPIAGDFPVQLATSRTHTTILVDLSADLSDTFLARMFVRDARVYTCNRVLYTISYRVHVYQITR